MKWVSAVGIGCVRPGSVVSSVGSSRTLRPNMMALLAVARQDRRSHPQLHLPCAFRTPPMNLKPRRRHKRPGVRLSHGIGTRGGFRGNLAANNVRGEGDMRTSLKAILLAGAVAALSGTALA